MGESLLLRVCNEYGSKHKKSAGREMEGRLQIRRSRIVEEQEICVRDRVDRNRMGVDPAVDDLESEASMALAMRGSNGMESWASVESFTSVRQPNPMVGFGFSI